MATPPAFSAEDRQRLLALEDSYLGYSDPLRQSGYHGGPVNWRKKRGIMLEAVNRDGSFLDVGCANGYLLECFVPWAQERGVRLTPYGLDIGERLVALARLRLPQWAEHFFVGNIWDWEPPRRFDFVSTSLMGAEPDRTELFLKLSRRIVAPGGRLILRSYYNHPGENTIGETRAFLEAHGVPIAGGIASEPTGADYVWIDC